MRRHIGMSEAQAEQNGRDAFKARPVVLISENPHSPWDAELHDAWLLGYMEAMEEEIERRRMRAA